MTEINYPLVIHSKLFRKYPELFFAFSTRDWMDFDNNVKEDDDKSDLLLQSGIKKRFKRFFEFLNISPDNIVTQKQIHSTNINYCEFPCHFDNSDGLHTNNKNIFLIIKAADCIPIFLYDPERKVIAGVHSGWKGTHHKILTKMISEINNIYGVHPENLIAYIGPGISGENYEVSKEVADKFPDECKEIKNGKYYLDLKKDNYLQLIKSGVRKENIEVSPLCTYKKNDLLFSYRKEKQKAGRMIGIIGITDSND
jgi:YfiH family protein